MLAAALSLIWVASASAAQPALANPHAITGTIGQVSTLSGMSIARDGTGGIVYLADTSGTEHVYVSRLVDGVFQSPVQVDAGLSGASSQPVIAAGNGGILLIGFVNGGNLYVTGTAGSTAGWQSPSELHAAASDPSISMSNAGKAYLAFTATAGSGSDVEAEYFAGGGWQPATAPLNVNPGDDAGTGAGRPAVVTAGDGVAIVAWGENGHVYARRVWATSPSVVDEQLDPSSFGGASEVSSGSPAISAGGDSSYPDIAYDETLKSGSSTWNRVLMTRLISEDVGSTTAVDGLSGTTPGSAGSPAVAMGEYGTGYVVASDNSDDQLVGTPLGNNGGPSGPPYEVSQGISTSPILGVPAIAGMFTTLIAWEQSSSAGSPQVVMRYGLGGTTLGSPAVLSAPGAQPRPADGLAAAGDNGGDAAVAWVQGASPSSLSLEVSQDYEPPAAPGPKHFSYSRSAQPTLTWNAAQHRWGPITYRVTLDGKFIGQTSSTSLQVPSRLTDGRNVWNVTAGNPAGETTTSRNATVFVDTRAPSLRIGLSGRDRRGKRLTLRVHAADHPAPEPGAKASGIASVRITWGDGAVQQGRYVSSAHHVYLRSGRFRIRVRVTDKAGNAVTVSRTVRIRR